MAKLIETFAPGSRGLGEGMNIIHCIMLTRAETDYPFKFCSRVFLFGLTWTGGVIPRARKIEAEDHQSGQASDRISEPPMLGSDRVTTYKEGKYMVFLGLPSLRQVTLCPPSQIHCLEVGKYSSQFACLLVIKFNR